MSRSPLSRLLGFALALTAGFATPASALAHGHAHEHEAEAHAAAEHGDADRVTSAHDQAHDHIDVTSGLATPTVASTDRDQGEHPHSSVDAALTTKAATALVILVAATVVLPSGREVTIAPPVPETTLQFRVEAAHAPPPRLRAPPALLG